MQGIINFLKSWEVLSVSFKISLIFFLHVQV